jgi:hypothetical protein
MMSILLMVKAFPYRTLPHIVQIMQTLPELTLEELLASITEPPEPEVDWGQPMGDEVW